MSDNTLMTGQMTGSIPTDWRKVRRLLAVEQISELARMTTGDICYKYGLPERQARRWREKAGEEIKRSK
jgi:hypothetical protein